MSLAKNARYFCAAHAHTVWNLFIYVYTQYSKLFILHIRRNVSLGTPRAIHNKLSHVYIMFVCLHIFLSVYFKI